MFFSPKTTFTPRHLDNSRPHCQDYACPFVSATGSNSGATGVSPSMPLPGIVNMLAMAMGPGQFSTGPQEPAKKEDPIEVIRNAYGETSIDDMIEDGEPLYIPDIKKVAGWDCDDICVDTSEEISLPENYKITFLLINWTNESPASNVQKPRTEGHWVLNIHVDGKDYILNPGGKDPEVFERPQTPKEILDKIQGLDGHFPVPEDGGTRRRSTGHKLKVFDKASDIYKEGSGEPDPSTRSPETIKRIKKARGEEEK